MVTGPLTDRRSEMDTDELVVEAVDEVMDQYGLVVVDLTYDDAAAVCEQVIERLRRELDSYRLEIAAGRGGETE